LLRARGSRRGVFTRSPFRRFEPAYADTFFQLRRSETFEHVRVAKALVQLTELREAFGQGNIGWTVLKAITRVASTDRPRDSSFGLPNLGQKLVLRFARSDMTKVRTWLEGVCVTVAETTGAEEVSLEQGMIVDAGPGKVAGDPVAYRAQIVYQHCPDCRKARVGTRDGFVEVTADEVERFEGSAEQVVLDGPTPPKLRRRVLAREAGRCGNPRCGHRADHCHHIVFRSRGGKTESANEVAVCTTCHALVHAGLLRVSGCADGELQWRPVVSADTLDREVTWGRAAATRLSSLQANRLPVLHLVAEVAQGGTPAGDSRQSANADSVLDHSPRGGAITADAALNREDLAHGLKRLGVPLARSRQLIDAAIASMPRVEISEENVLWQAIGSI